MTGPGRAAGRIRPRLERVDALSPGAAAIPARPPRVSLLPEYPCGLAVRARRLADGPAHPYLDTATIGDRTMDQPLAARPLPVPLREVFHACFHFPFRPVLVHA